MVGCVGNRGDFGHAHDLADRADGYAEVFAANSKTDQMQVFSHFPFSPRSRAGHFRIVHCGATVSGVALGAASVLCLVVLALAILALAILAMAVLAVSVMAVELEAAHGVEQGAGHFGH